MTREILPAGHLEASKVEESNLVGAESVSGYRMMATLLWRNSTGGTVEIASANAFWIEVL